MIRHFFGAKRVGTQSTAPSKLKWTRHGWQKVQATREDVASWRASKTKTPESNDFNFKTRQPDLALIQDAHNEIMYGSIGSKLDELPQVLRDILYQPDKWFLNRNYSKLYAVTDPITQVYEFDDWGTDRSEADAETLNERPSASRLFLESANIISPEATTERVTDILGAIAYDQNGKDFNVYHSPFATRMDTDIASVAVAGEDKLLGEEASSDDVESAFTQARDEEVIVRRDPRTVTSALPEISDEAVASIKKITTTFTELLKKVATDSEYTALTLQYEQALDREVGTEITTRLNSPYCGYGYSAPRRHHAMIKLPEVRDISEAAEERIAFFYQLFGEATSCDSRNDLFGSYVVDPLTGQGSRPGGFVGKIRGMYHHDKALWAKWSLHDLVDRKTGEIIHRSAFSIAREQFIREWREEEKGDEEKLRVAVWAWFDRKEKIILGERDASGKITQKFKRYKDSIWRQRRTQAFKETYLTKKQWDAIYKMIDIVKKRINVQLGSSQDRRKVLDLLAKHFTRITNLEDLRAYKAWAQKRRFRKKYETYGFAKKVDGSLVTDKDGNHIPKQRSVPTYDFIPSMLDKITVLDETKWRKSCAKKKRHLIGREVLYRQLRTQVNAVRETTLEEIAISCTHHKCMTEEELQRQRDNPAVHVQVIPAMAIGRPKFYEIKNGKGLLGLECDQCERIVWMLGHKETPELKTYEEVHSGN